MTFTDLRREYENGGMTLLYELLVGLCRSIAGRYPPAVYNSNLDWSEDAFNDLAQEVAVDRLLDGGQLDYVFKTATELETLRRLLVHQIRLTLRKRRQIGPVDRIMRRVRRLANEGFPIRGEGPEPFYRAEAASPDPLEIAPELQREAVRAASVVPILVSRSNSSRESQIFTKTALREVLAAFFSVCPALYERDLRTLFEELLTPWTRTTIEPYELAVAPADDDVTGLGMIGADEVVSEWVGGLSDDECLVFYLRSRWVPDHVIAERIGRSRATVISIKQRVLAAAGRALLADFDEPAHLEVIRRAQELCAARLGGEE